MKSDKKEFIRIFLDRHKMLFRSLIVITGIFFIAGFFVDKHLALMTGEQSFSFDYFGHIRNILGDFIRDKTEILRTNSCLDCTPFYHYSRWFSLFYFFVLGTGGLLPISPALNYAFQMIVVQLIAVYISFRLIFGRLSFFPFFVALFVFILIPVNYVYIGSDMYTFHHAFMILSLALVNYTQSRIGTLKVRTVFLLGLYAGFSGFTFLNISLGFLPIFLYSFLLVFIYGLIHTTRFFLKHMLFFITSFGTIIMLNIPIVISVFLHGNPKRFLTYQKLSLLDSFSSGMTYVPSKLENLDPWIIVMFFLVFTFLAIVAKLTVKQKIILAAIYLLSGYILMGNPVYDFLFHKLPLLDSLRSHHRILVIEEIILTIFIYSGLVTLWNSKPQLRRSLAVICSVLLIMIPSVFIWKNLNYLNPVLIPEEYFQADSFLSGLSGKKIYFPAYLPWGGSINQNYSWATTKPVHPTLYQNPFTSLFAVPEMINLEKAPDATAWQNELRSLIDYQNPAAEIIESLARREIRYVVLDKNFLWDKNFPEVKPGQLVENLNKIKSFGGIEIYEVEKVDGGCPLSFGNYNSRYCHVRGNQIPEVLIDKSKEDFLVEQYTPTQDELLPLLKNKNTYNHIADPALQRFVMKEKIFYGDVYLFDNRKKKEDMNVFEKYIVSGKYILIVPILKLGSNDSFFQKATLEIYQGHVKEHVVSANGPSKGMIYERLPLDLSEPTVVSGRISGDDFLVISPPFILPESRFREITSEKKQQDLKLDEIRL